MSRLQSEEVTGQRIEVLTSCLVWFSVEVVRCSFVSKTDCCTFQSTVTPFVYFMCLIVHQRSSRRIQFIQKYGPQTCLLRLVSSVVSYLQVGQCFKNNPPTVSESIKYCRNKFVIQRTLYVLLIVSSWYSIYLSNRLLLHQVNRFVTWWVAEPVIQLVPSHARRIIHGKAPGKSL